MPIIDYPMKSPKRCKDKSDGHRHCDQCDKCSVIHPKPNIHHTDKGMLCKECCHLNYESWQVSRIEKNYPRYTRFD